jgi:hypothetical protein
MKLLNGQTVFNLNQAINTFGAKGAGVSLEHFRAAVWAVFVQLVYTTPQFSGKAAANWNIGINSPDLEFDPDMGEQMDVVAAKSGGMKFTTITPRQQGDNKWAEESLERNKRKRNLIMSNTRVFITNATKGDIDTAHGRTSPYYLSDLQDVGYWSQKLRLVNMPYETVSEVLLSESWRQNLHLKGDANNQEFFK